VTAALPAATDRTRSAALTTAQARIVSAALELFARHGVGGTSLQMIAERIGVTKAAVYHQYKTKDEIVFAAAEAEVARLEQVMDAAEAEPNGSRARDALLRGIVDLAVERRRTTSTILGDPVVVRLVAREKRFRQVTDRLYQLLVGEDAGSDAYVRAAMLTAAISGAAMHPLVVDHDDDMLREQLLDLARRFLDLPSPRRRRVRSSPRPAKKR
jgi:AcrR family transcriptional regulator